MSLTKTVFSSAAISLPWASREDVTNRDQQSRWLRAQDHSGRQFWRDIAFDDPLGKTARIPVRRGAGASITTLNVATPAPVPATCWAATLLTGLIGKGVIAAQTESLICQSR
jgi:hypothetical protein